MRIILMGIVATAVIVCVGIVIGRAIAKYLISRTGGVSAEKLYKDLIAKYGITE